VRAPAGEATARWGKEISVLHSTIGTLHGTIAERDAQLLEANAKLSRLSAVLESALAAQGLTESSVMLDRPLTGK
jgi:hypothetical protein